MPKVPAFYHRLFLKALLLYSRNAKGIQFSCDMCRYAFSGVESSPLWRPPFAWQNNSNWCRRHNGLHVLVIALSRALNRPNRAIELCGVALEPSRCYERFFIALKPVCISLYIRSLGIKGTTSIRRAGARLECTSQEHRFFLSLLKALKSVLRYCDVLITVNVICSATAERLTF